MRYDEYKNRKKYIDKMEFKAIYSKKNKKLDKYAKKHYRAKIDLNYDLGMYKIEGDK